MFHAEGPIVISKGQGDHTGDPRPPLLHIGMPENMITWALTPDLPTLKVQRTAFMAAVPYSTCAAAHHLPACCSCIAVANPGSIAASELPCLSHSCLQAGCYLPQ